MIKSKKENMKYETMNIFLQQSVGLWRHEAKQQLSETKNMFLQYRSQGRLHPDVA